MTRYVVRTTSDGGFHIRELLPPEGVIPQYGKSAFFGTLDECLAYVKNKFEERK